MKVGYHSSEDLDEIIARKQQEEKECGYLYWGYGGSLCHPINQVNPFVQSLSQNEEIWLLMIITQSKFKNSPLLSQEFSKNGKLWLPIPTGINVTGSKYALVCKEIQPVDFNIDLSQYYVAIGKNKDCVVSKYMRHRVDKCCAYKNSINTNTNLDNSCFVKISFQAKLVNPFAVFLRSDQDKIKLSKTQTINISYLSETQKELLRYDPEDKHISIISWNVNGIRSVQKKGFLEWLYDTKPYILCLQEIKANVNQLNSQLKSSHGYYTYWNSASKNGYSGTALFSLEKPLNVEFGFGQKEYGNEGRIIIAEYLDFILINCYIPHGGQHCERVDYKLKFCNLLLEKCEQLKSKNKMIIICGDINTAHHNIDVSNPSANKRKSGFLPEERAWIDTFISSGYVDTFRSFYPDLKNQYTWWSNRSNARENNKGWRLDYFFIDQENIEKIKTSFILNEVLGSDHCPICVCLEVNNKQLNNLLPTCHYSQMELNIF